MELSTNATLRAKARESLSGRWAMAVVATIVYMAIAMTITSPASISYNRFLTDLQNAPSLFAGPFFEGTLWSTLSTMSFLACVFVAWPLAYGYITTFITTVRDNSEFEINGIFSGFGNYTKVFSTMLLMNVYVGLWSCLLFVPGVIKSYSYAMTPYILAENPGIGADEAICKSMKMMDGQKMDLFLLDLSFLGWLVLACLTCGVGLLWLMPYMNSARAAFYLDLNGATAATQE